jgi:hypothetical protein
MRVLRRVAMRCLPGLAAAIIAIDLGARMPDAVEIPAVVWAAELPFSPQLPEFAPGLALAIGSGQKDRSPVAVAAVRYRMPDPVVQRYRGRVSPAIMLVAVDIDSGAVYAAPCMDHDAGPATFDESAVAQSPIGAPAVGGFIAVDIVELLKLPPTRSRYMVFAWLDEWISAPRGLELAADPKRAETPIRRVANATPAARTAAADAARLPAGIAFHPPSADRMRMSWNVARPSAVVLLGYGLEDRAVHWEVLAPPGAPHARTGVGEVAVPAFVGKAVASRTAFAAFAGGEVAAVMPADKP